MTTSASECRFQKLNILQTLPKEGLATSETKNQVLNLPHEDILRFLGNGNARSGEIRFERISNLELGQAIAFDLNQYKNFHLVFGPQFNTYLSQIEKLEQELNEAQELEASILCKLLMMNVIQPTVRLTAQT